MKDINTRLDEILPKISDPSFRKNKGLGNEIGFYIFDYSPEFELLVRESIQGIKETAKANYGLKIFKKELSNGREKR